MTSDDDKSVEELHPELYKHLGERLAIEIWMSGDAVKASIDEESLSIDQATLPDGYTITRVNSKSLGVTNVMIEEVPEE